MKPPDLESKALMIAAISYKNNFGIISDNHNFYYGKERFWNRLHSDADDPEGH